jgi:hypothetical protein
MHRQRRVAASTAMDDGARKWLYKTARCRRVPLYCDYDDLIQDGQMIYIYLQRRYPNVTNRSNFMRLFQVSYLNHLSNLGRDRYQEAGVMVEHPDPTSLQPPCYDQAFLMVLKLKRAPPDIQATLNCLHSDQGQRTWRAPYQVRNDGTRRTFNERLCRMIGSNPDRVDLPVNLHGFLTT